jgi:hypothetical protein
MAAPNIFNNYSAIKYELTPDKAHMATFTITDISGKVITSIKPENNIGTYIFGTGLEAGIYFITLQANEIFQTIKVIKTI